MSDQASNSNVPDSAIQVCVRVRPLNNRELDEGHRVCVSFDEPSKQVVLTAVDKATLLQLRGATAKGYAFDRRYSQDQTSDSIYEDSISQLVENCLKGYNGTVLAYGQTGSGKTHTMSGGVGIHGVVETGIAPRVIQHIFSIVEQLRKRAKPGEKTEVSACALELYNEDLRDLAERTREDVKGWDGAKQVSGSLKLQERPSGKDGRVVPEVIGVKEMKVETGEELSKFFADCMDNRSTSSTKLNDRSSRSHAIFTITIHRTIVEVLNELDEGFKARVRTSEFKSKLHLVDLAGSERVKRSGVTGKELKEATHINSGLLALGNVIVALADESESKKKGHIPYRDSKLTRLLQDSLGGNSLTVLISCISPSELDFEETNNTLKYANRACHIKNTPLPNKFLTLEEDLLPALPSAGGTFGLIQLQALLEEHGKIKEVRERKERERREREAKKLSDLLALQEQESKTPGFQRLRANQYDELRRQLVSRGNASISKSAVIADDTLKGFGRRSVNVSGTEDRASAEGVPSYMRPTTASGTRPAFKSSRSMRDGESSPHQTPRSRKDMVARSSTGKAVGGGFASWLATQQAGGEEGSDTGSGAGGESQFYDDQFYEDEGHADDGSFFEGEGEGETEEQLRTNSGLEEQVHSMQVQDRAAEQFFEDEGEAAKAAGKKSKFRRGAKGAENEQAEEAAAATGGDVRVDADTFVGDAFSESKVEEDDGILELGEMPKLLARFKVNQLDSLAVFKATTKEDFKDVIGLLPENTPLPASDKMTYLLARLEVHNSKDIEASLLKVAANELTMNEAVGPAVGCLMATFGTNMISSCIFEFEDPVDLELFTVDERIELWGLQIPHNSVRPTLQPLEPEKLKETEEKDKDIITWTSVDRLNMSIGLLYALCSHARESAVRCGFCVPRPQLLKRWLQAGVKMKQIQTPLKLIYPPSAHDYEYYKASTVAYFMVDEVQEALARILSILR